MLEAVIDLVNEHGNEAVTVEMVTERAGVERAAFERDFASLGDCIIQAFRAKADLFNGLARGAFQRERAWRDSLRAAAYVAARFFRDNPRIIQFGTLQMLQAGPMAQAERERQLSEIVELIDAGRQELDDPESIGRGVAEGVLGSIYELLIREVQAGRGTGSAEEFVPELMYLAVRPYLGDEVAREELRIPPPPESAES